jgi:hypothetical protein
MGDRTSPIRYDPSISAPQFAPWDHQWIGTLPEPTPACTATGTEVHLAARNSQTLRTLRPVCPHFREGACRLPEVRLYSREAILINGDDLEARSSGAAERLQTDQAFAVRRDSPPAPGYRHRPQTSLPWGDVMTPDATAHHEPRLTVPQFTMAHPRLVEARMLVDAIEGADPWLIGDGVWPNRRRCKTTLRAKVEQGCRSRSAGFRLSSLLLASKSRRRHRTGFAWRDYSAGCWPPERATDSREDLRCLLNALRQLRPSWRYRPELGAEQALRHRCPPVVFVDEAHTGAGRIGAEALRSVGCHEGDPTARNSACLLLGPLRFCHSATSAPAKPPLPSSLQR